MTGFVTIGKHNIDDYLDRHAVIVFELRNSRDKAKQLAILEASFVLSAVDGLLVANGPLGDVRGVFSFFVPVHRLGELKALLPGIGYCDRFWLLEFDAAKSENESDIVTANDLVWKGRRFSIRGFFVQDPGLYDDHSAHNRTFKILDADGEPKVVCGYRGDGTETGRRALPVEDARCMVNLSDPRRAARLLDPFAGGGGIVHQAAFIQPGLEVHSIDIDPVVAPGLRLYGAKHHVGDAGQVPLPAEWFDAIVTEVPFSPHATEHVLRALAHLQPALKADGNLVLMCAAEQAEAIDRFAGGMGLHRYVRQPVNRKGTAVEIMAWSNSFEKVEKMRDFRIVVKRIR